jgi:hypothetical protein
LQTRRNLPENSYKSAQEFLCKMDSGLLDGKFVEEVQKLSPAQIKEITDILLQRTQSNTQVAKRQKRLLCSTETIILTAKSDPQNSVFMVGLESDPTAWAIEDNLEGAIESWILSEVRRYERNIRHRLHVTKAYRHNSDN